MTFSINLCKIKNWIEKDNNKYMKEENAKNIYNKLILKYKSHIFLYIM